MSTDIAGLIERARASVEAAKADPARTPANERFELQRVAQQFEAMLLTQMLREMRKAGEWDTDADKSEQGMGLGTESFTEAIDAELGLHLARHRGIGLTSQLMQAFDRMAGASAPNTADAVDAPLDPAIQSRVPLASSATTLPAPVTSAFGWRSDPFTGLTTFHRGVDLRAAYGEDVQAAAPGRVVFSGEQQGFGTTVVIEHADGSRSRYAHLSATTVEVGAEVGARELVGRAGQSGRATGTHLHFEVTGPRGEALPPGRWLQRWANTTGA